MHRIRPAAVPVEPAGDLLIDALARLTEASRGTGSDGQVRSVDVVVTRLDLQLVVGLAHRLHAARFGAVGGRRPS